MKIDKLDQLKLIITQNEKLLNKYKNVILDIDKVCIFMDNKIKNINYNLDYINNLLIESIELYHKICKNLIN